MKVETTKNGNLRLTLEPHDAALIEYYKDLEQSEFDIMAALLERYSTNGSYSPIRPCDWLACCSEEFGIVSEQCFNEAGEYVFAGVSVWYDAANWCRDITDALLKDSVILTLVNESGFNSEVME